MISTIDGLRSRLAEARAAAPEGARVALISTIGALHDGHIDLVHRAREVAEVVVVSVFVNPLRFANPTEFAAYPRTPDDDEQLLESLGVDVIFAPDAAELLPDGTATTKVTAGDLGLRYEGRARPFYFSIGGEGSDGSPGEAYDEYALQPRVTDAPGAALRHTAYFDDPLVMTLEPGWSVELTGSERIGDRESWRLRVEYPDGFTSESFVDMSTWLVVARRFTAPVHAFGANVTSQAILGDYRPVSGVLYPFSLREVNLATGEPMAAFTWQSIEANVALDPAAFSPPVRPTTPVSRLVNAIFAARHVTADALGWYHDFQRNPATAGVDIQGAVESVAYECLKNGAIPTGTALLEENLRAHPASARAHFGVGRAYRAAGREEDALRAFREALRLDPSLKEAEKAIASRRLEY